MATGDDVQQIISTAERYRRMSFKTGIGAQSVVSAVSLPREDSCIKEGLLLRKGLCDMCQSQLGC